MCSSVLCMTHFLFLKLLLYPVICLKVCVCMCACVSMCAWGQRTSFGSQSSSLLCGRMSLFCVPQASWLTSFWQIFFFYLHLPSHYGEFAVAITTSCIFFLFLFFLWILGIKLRVFRLVWKVTFFFFLTHWAISPTPAWPFDAVLFSSISFA